MNHNLGHALFNAAVIKLKLSNYTNATNAIKMLKKASELNNSNSLSLLANIYLVGYTVPVNITLGL